MVTLLINGKKQKLPEEKSLKELSEEQQKDYPHQIVLALQNGKLRELYHSVDQGGTLEWITTDTEIGSKTYFRSLIFLLGKAYFDVMPETEKNSLNVDFTVSNGLFCLNRYRKITKTEIKKIENRMREIVEMDVPFVKESMSTSEVEKLFLKMGLVEKAATFRLRRASETNIYRLLDYPDYYYAYLVPSSGYLRYFALLPYADGFILQRPTKSEPEKILPYVPQEKLFQTMKRASAFCRNVGIEAVGSLNQRIVAGKTRELLLLQEAVMEKEIGNIAGDIQKSQKKIVMIAGPSSSGKTTFANRLAVQLMALGITPHLISCDDYFRPRREYVPDENGKIDFEALSCVDVDLLNKDFRALLSGKEVEMPHFNFVTGEREYNGKRLRLSGDDLIIMEGIHCMNDRLTPEIKPEEKYKIYISALTQLNLDEHNHISTSDGRLLRRIIRDARLRAYSAETTINRWESVRKGEENNIFPYQESADVMVNSALIYELSVLKPYAEPLLFQVPKDSEAYFEAKRLLKFLDYFLAIPAEDVPANSLVREFIGGGCFDV